jgi:hypothetical protein
MRELKECAVGFGMRRKRSVAARTRPAAASARRRALRAWLGRSVSGEGRVAR